MASVVLIFLGMSTVLFLLSRVGMNCIVSSLKAGNLCTNTSCTREYRMKICMIHFIAAVGLSVGVGAASGQSLNEDLKLTASDGVSGDLLGASIGIYNGIVAVGTRHDDNENGTNSGAVYLFDASTGEELFKLMASDGSSADWFGDSLAIHNGLMIVGAQLDDVLGSASGSAYLIDLSTGEELFKLSASDGDSNDKLGYSVAIHNGIVAVGAINDDDLGTNSGAVYIFDALTGEELFKFTASDGASGDRFGSSVAIDKGILAVGAPNDDGLADNSGSVYLLDISTGVELFKITGSDGDPIDDWFGSTIAFDNGILAVGVSEDDSYGTRSGSTYLFDASTGIQLFNLTASDRMPGDRFGYSLSLNDGILAVGAVEDRDDLGFPLGSAYLFDVATGVQRAKLTASDGEISDAFGRSIAVSNEIVAVAASSDDDLGVNSGSAYIFDVSCRVDMNNDLTLNFYDVSAFFGLFVDGDLAVDFNGDGDLNFGDVSIFIADFGQGCPLVN